jgi:hypothetical protein
MNKKLLLGFLLSVFSGAQANAVIIEGEFGGFITEITDRGNYDPDYTPFWRNVKLGDAVHGTYWYDTALAPSPVELWNNRTQYRNHGPNIPAWSGMTATVDGRVFDITQDQPNSEWWKHEQSDRGILITNEADDGYMIADGFSMINSISWITGGFQFSSTTLLFSIWLEEVELFNSTELGQEFSWVNENLDTIYNGGVISKSGYNENGHYDSDVRFKTTYVTARIKKATEVNEPGLLILMLIGISGLTFRRKMKTE